MSSTVYCCILCSKYLLPDGNYSADCLDVVFDKHVNLIYMTCVHCRDRDDFKTLSDKERSDREMLYLDRSIAGNFWLCDVPPNLNFTCTLYYQYGDNRPEEVFKDTVRGGGARC